MDLMNVPAKVEVRSFRPTRSWDNSGYLKKLWAVPGGWIRRSRSPKGSDFGANRMRVYDFLLVRNSVVNIGWITARLALKHFLTSGRLVGPSMGSIRMLGSAPSAISVLLRLSDS